MAIIDARSHLLDYIGKHFGFESINVFDLPDVVYADCTFTVRKSVYTARLLMPRDAPHGARPLFSELRIGEMQLWTFKRDVEPYLAFNEPLMRIHPFLCQGILLQVHVREGDPPHVIRVSNMTDENLRIDVEALLKEIVSKRWSMRTDLSPAEKEEVKKALR